MSRHKQKKVNRSGAGKPGGKARKSDVVNASSAPDYERVIIEGVWQLLTPMHIGAGTSREIERELSEHQAKKAKEEGGSTKASTEIACFCKDKQGMPYIPASSLRGFFRGIITAIDDAKSQQDLSSLFGCASPEREAQEAELKDKGSSGLDFHSRLRVYDARWDKSRSTNALTPEVAAEITTHVAINPVTRTAEESLLYSKEQVPAGEYFSCVIEIDRVSKDELTLFMRLLETLSQPSLSHRLGAGANKLQGQLLWRNTRLGTDAKTKPFVKVIDRKAFQKWLNPPKKSQGDRSSKVPSNFSAQADFINYPNLEVFNLIDKGVEIPLTIYPQSPLLLPDANKSKPKKSDKDGTSSWKEGDPDEQGLIASRYCQQTKKYIPRLIIPASSLLGAFRAQCRKILMTLAIEHFQQSVSKQDTPDYRVQALAVDEMMQQYFGRTGKRSLIWLSEAQSSPDAQFEEHPQFFNAIDRFTGGGADGALFNTMAYTCDKMQCTLRLQAALFTKPTQADASTNIGGLALVLLALRDAVEGDITVGTGGAYQYGHNLMAVKDTEKGQWQASRQALANIVADSPFNEPTLTQAFDELEQALSEAIDRVTSAEEV